MPKVVTECVTWIALLGVFVPIFIAVSAGIASLHSTADAKVERRFTRNEEYIRRELKSISESIGTVKELVIHNTIMVNVIRERQHKKYSSEGYLEKDRE